ncbi:MAG: GGDEF domain-containing protein, partial [Solirubrobacterales bacterium]
FKLFNTSLGHSGGDALLRAVAANLRGAVGDEFAVLAGVEISRDAVAISERCRAAVAGADQDIGVTVTASVGYAVWRETLGVHDLAIEADLALRVSKDRGKNSVSESRPLHAVRYADDPAPDLASAARTTKVRDTLPTRQNGPNDESQAAKAQADSPPPA